MSGELGKIQKTLKELMRKKHLSYQDLSQNLGVSEATIKRRLNGDDISIEQLQEMISALDVNFYEVIELSKEQDSKVHSFTFDQETYLSKDLRHMQVFRLLLMKKSLPQITKLVEASEGVLRKILRHFEDLELIKLMPNDRIILRAQYPFRWLPQGPLERTYEKLIIESIGARIKDPALNGINKKFEIALPSDLHKDFVQDLDKVLQKYRNLSKVHLESKIEPSDLTSGILFVDRFSCWDQSNKKL